MAASSLVHKIFNVSESRVGTFTLLRRFYVCLFTLLLCAVYDIRSAIWEQKAETAEKASFSI